MEATRLIELFELIKTNINQDSFKLKSGICYEIIKLYVNKIITREEKEYLNFYLYENKPKVGNQYEKFIYGKYWDDDDFWWLPIDEMPRTKRSRTNYLTKLIANIK